MRDVSVDRITSLAGLTKDQMPRSWECGEPSSGGRGSFVCSGAVGGRSEIVERFRAAVPIRASTKRVSDGPCRGLVAVAEAEEIG